MKRQCGDQPAERESSAARGKHCTWTVAEDQLLLQMANNIGTINWNDVAKALEHLSSIPGECKTPRQCRERWNNRVNPSIKVAPWTEEEEGKFFELHRRLGPKWSEMALHLPGRTDNTIKNLFYCRLRKIARRINKGIVSTDMKSCTKEVDHTLYLIEHLRQCYLSNDADMKQGQGDKYIAEMVEKSHLTVQKLDKYLAEYLSAVRVYNHNRPDNDDSSTRSHGYRNPQMTVSQSVVPAKRLCIATSASGLFAQQCSQDSYTLTELEEWRSTHPQRAGVTLPLPDSFVLSQSRRPKSEEEGFRPTLFFNTESSKTQQKMLPYYLICNVRCITGR